MNADNILFRSSSCGNLMTESMGKTNFEKFEEAKNNLDKYQQDYDGMKNKATKTAEKKLIQIDKINIELPFLESRKDIIELSKSCKTHLIDVFVSNKYGRNTNVHTKYTTKGLMVEEDSMTLYSRFKKEFYKKNEKYFTNDFLRGTPDIIDYDQSLIIDIKSSWDIFTFYRNLAGDLKNIYYWQLQAYMALTGMKRAKLAYCLIDTPAPLIHAQKRKLMYDMGLRDIDDNMNLDFMKGCEEIDKLSIYDDIPMDEKVLEIYVERNDHDIERMYERIVQCRKYMNENLFNKVVV